MPSRRRRRSERASHQRCAFCERDIGDDEEVFGFGVKSRPGTDLDHLRGSVIQMTVESLGKDVPAVVTTADSPAAAQGYDLYLMTCSEGCAVALKAALDRDIAGADGVD